MKITIDTQVDSQQDIQKVLQILSNTTQNRSAPIEQQQHVVARDHNERTQVSKVSSQQTDTTSMMGMFDAPKETPPDFSALLNLQEKKEEKPRIELF